MKQLLHTAGSLFLDQFIGVIAGMMMPLCVAMLFGNRLPGYLLAAAITIFLYAYCAYRSGFKGGTKDVHRATNTPSYKGYLYRGALAGLIAAAPLLIVYIIYKATGNGNAAFIFMMSNMYWTWPLKGSFPNHQQLIMATAFVPMIALPWLGYIAGYKQFLFSDLVMKMYKKIVERLPEE